MKNALNTEKKQPLVSVVIPNYNHGKYIRQRIQSVLNQSYINIEVIILDDCSRDNSLTVISEFASDRRIKHVIVNEVNSGSPFRQWSKGIEMCRGDWIWIAESDDWCENSLLEVLVDGIREDVVLCFCATMAFRDNSIMFIGHGKRLIQYWNGVDFIKNNLIDEISIFNASMAIFRRSAYASVNMDYVNYKFSGDVLFWIGIASSGNVYQVSRVLNYFRSHDLDVSTQAAKYGWYYSEQVAILKYLFENKLCEDWRFYEVAFKRIKQIKTSETLDENSKIVLIKKFKESLSKSKYIKMLLMNYLYKFTKKTPSNYNNFS